MVERTYKRSKAQERLIKIMTKRGGKGFRILRSAETTMKHYKRPERRSK
jgi:hypothetical protein